MINRVQVLWYLNKDDLENYCLDFKPYKSHKLEGYEICEVDEDLIFDLCDRDPDRLQPVDYFKNRTEVENYLTDYITNEEYKNGLCTKDKGSAHRQRQNAKRNRAGIADHSKLLLTV